MPNYRYESKGASSKVTTGTVVAANLAAASAQLRAGNQFSALHADLQRQGSRSARDPLRLSLPTPLGRLRLIGRPMRNIWQAHQFFHANHCPSFRQFHPIFAVLKQFR
jgi:hypothetical protein